MPSDTAVAHISRIQEIPGYFSSADARAFIALSQAQRQSSVTGDFLEIGTWYGRSAVLLGYLINGDERLHVNDLFDSSPETAAGRQELSQAGPIKLPTRADFEGNYLRFHSGVPEIHAAPSSALHGRLRPASFRFVHIDGSHTQEAVASDIELAQALLAQGGIVAFDDYANTRHPGVAAALWPVLAEGKFRAFASTRSKLFVTTDSMHANAYRRTLEGIGREQGWKTRSTTLNGEQLLMLQQPSASHSLASRIVRRLQRIFTRLTNPLGARSHGAGFWWMSWLASCL